MGFILYSENFLFRARWLIDVCRSLYWKLGEILGTFAFHPSNFEQNLGSKTTHGTRWFKS